MARKKEMCSSKSNEPGAGIVLLKLEELHSFEGHPFKVERNQELFELRCSIEKEGVLVPLLVRKNPHGDGYEIISGHRRKEAALWTGLTKVPVIIRELDDDQSVIAMIDSNLQREKILPSEKAYAYKMRLEALSRQGKRTDLTSDPVGWKSSGKETAQLIGEQSGDSQTQVRRYIRLTNLVPELLEYVDEGRIKMRPAVELSFLDEDSQRDVVDEIDLNDATPSHDQTIRMRKFFEEGKLTTEAIQAIMSEEKPNQREKIVLRGDRVRQLIPKNIPISQTEDFVCKALEHYNKFLRSRADRDSR